MFNSLSHDERLELQKQIDDLARELEFVKRERASDNERLETKKFLEGQNKRLEHIENKEKALARADASEAIAKAAKEYADKTVLMAEKVASDFGNAIGKALEQVVALLKEFKPVAPTMQVLPVAGGKCDTHIVK